MAARKKAARVKDNRHRTPKAKERYAPTTMYVTFNPEDCDKDDDVPPEKEPVCIFSADRSVDNISTAQTEDRTVFVYRLVAFGKVESINSFVTEQTVLTMDEDKESE